MKTRALDMIVCPNCEAETKIDIFRQEHGEIIEALMTCGCGEWYPVIAGVPRMLKGVLKSGIIDNYPGYFEKYGAKIGKRYEELQNCRKILNTGDKKKQTMSVFSYEWKEFSDYDGDNFAFWMPRSVNPSFFKDKVCLEAGCGAGRHTMQAAKYGAEMFSIDLSEAVDVAYEKNKENPKVHIFQADIYSLPFRKESFELIYCTGVIQHLDEPSMGVDALVPFLNKKAALIVNVYSDDRKILHFFLDNFRRITTKLPNRVVKAISLFLALFDYGALILPYKILTKIGIIKTIIEPVMWGRIRVYAMHSFTVCYADWFDRLAAPIIIRSSKSDVMEWYKKNKLTQVSVEMINRSFWAALGIKV